MPCFFVKNAPPILVSKALTQRGASNRFISDLAQEAGCHPTEVRVHFGECFSLVLTATGDVTYSYGIHVWVDWFEGRSIKQKTEIERIIREYFKTLSFLIRQSYLLISVDVTFVDRPRTEGVYFRNGDMVYPPDY